MAEDPPVLNFYPSKFNVISEYRKDQIVGESLPGANYHPFQVVNISSNGSSKVGVYFGTVNSIVPDEVNINPVDAKEFNVSTGDQLWINIDLDMDHMQLPSSVEIDKSPYPENQEDKARILLAEFSVEGDGMISIGQNVFDNIQLVSCGIHHMF